MYDERLEQKGKPLTEAGTGEIPSVASCYPVNCKKCQLSQCSLHCTHFEEMAEYKRAVSGTVRDMAEFQKKYFPKDVGVLCPHCRGEIKNGDHTGTGIGMIVNKPLGCGGPALPPTPYLKVK